MNDAGRGACTTAHDVSSPVPLQQIDEQPPDAPVSLPDRMHSSVSTTERHYIKDVPENTLEAMKQLEVLCKDRAKPEGTKPI